MLREEHRAMPACEEPPVLPGVPFSIRLHCAARGSFLLRVSGGAGVSPFRYESVPRGPKGDRKLPYTHYDKFLNQMQPYLTIRFPQTGS